MENVINTLESVGKFGAEWMMHNPELACCIMAGFLIGVVIHASCKMITR